MSRSDSSGSDCKAETCMRFSQSLSLGILIKRRPSASPDSQVKVMLDALLFSCSTSPNHRSPFRRPARFILAHKGTWSKQAASTVSAGLDRNEDFGASKSKGWSWHPSRKSSSRLSIPQVFIHGADEDTAIHTSPNRDSDVNPFLVAPMSTGARYDFSANDVPRLETKSMSLATMADRLRIRTSMSSTRSSPSIPTVYASITSRRSVSSPLPSSDATTACTPVPSLRRASFSSPDRASSVASAKLPLTAWIIPPSCISTKLLVPPRPPAAEESPPVALAAPKFSGEVSKPEKQHVADRRHLQVRTVDYSRRGSTSRDKLLIPHSRDPKACETEGMHSTDPDLKKFIAGTFETWL